VLDAATILVPASNLTQIIKRIDKSRPVARRDPTNGRIRSILVDEVKTSDLTQIIDSNCFGASPARSINWRKYSIVVNKPVSAVAVVIIANDYARIINIVELRAAVCARQGVVDRCIDSIIIDEPMAISIVVVIRSYDHAKIIDSSGLSAKVIRSALKWIIDSCKHTIIVDKPMYLIAGVLIRTADLTCGIDKTQFSAIC
jgi:hypothetical protein